MLVCCRFEGHIDCPPGMSHPSFSINHGILEAVRPRLKDFHQLLLEPPKVRKRFYFSLASAMGRKNSFAKPECWGKKWVSFHPWNNLESRVQFKIAELYLSNIWEPTKHLICIAYLMNPEAIWAVLKLLLWCLLCVNVQILASTRTCTHTHPMLTLENYLSCST